jgi:hypothetical protein
VFARTWCARHYHNWQRHGTPVIPRPADLPGEIWRPVVGYEGLYEVSSLARVWSTYRNGTMLKTHPRKKGGYGELTLMRDGVQTTHLVHWLVAAAFLGPCPDGQEVRHLDGNAGNSVVSNLAYGDHSTNIRDSVRHGTQRNTRKEECPQGHEYTPENTYSWPNKKTGRPERHCRICKRDQMNERYRQGKVTPRIADLSPEQLATRREKQKIANRRFREKQKASRPAPELPF